MAKPAKSKVVIKDSIPVNIGIPEEKRLKVATELSKALADSYTLYLMTHNFHWNVTGPMFNTLHNMFMDQYTELWQALDTLAERIRALGFFAPGTYAEFAKLSSIKEPTHVPNAEEMIRLLLEANEAVARTLRTVGEQAENANDQPTADIVTQRLEIHEKTAWMLRALIS